MQTQSRAPQQTATPAAATTQAPAPVASNAARAEDLGLTPQADPAATQTVVWDALPLEMALPMAWAERAKGYAREWIAALPGRDVCAEAGAWVGERLHEAVDGVALEVAFSGKAAVEASVGLGATLVLAGGSDGFALTLKANGSLGKDVGVDQTVKGVDGQVVGGAGASAGVEGALLTEFTWRWGSAEALLAEADTTELMRAMAFGIPGVLVYLQRVAVRLATEHRPDEVRLEGGVEGNGAVAAQPSMGIGGSVGGSQAGKVAVGREGDERYVEVSLSHGGADALALRLLGFFGDARLVTENEVTVRLWGDLERLLEGDLAGVSKAQASVKDTANATSFEDEATFRTVEAMASWIAGAVTAAGDVEGELHPWALPDVTLRRSLAKAADNAPEAVLASVHAAVLPYVGGEFAKSELDTRIEAEVAVDTDDVRVALAGQDLPVTDAGPEAAVLDVARAVVGAVQGVPYDTGLDLDLDAAKEAVAPEVKAEAVTELELAAGGEVSDALMVHEVGLGGRVGAKMTVRTPIATADAMAALA